MRSNSRRASYRNCRKTLLWFWTIRKRPPQCLPGSILLSVLTMKATGKDYNRLGNSSAVNIPTTMLNNVGSHRTIHCNELVFISNVSLWWRRSFEKFLNIIVSRPRRCSWRFVVKPYWNEHRFWRSLSFSEISTHFHQNPVVSNAYRAQPLAMSSLSVPISSSLNHFFVDSNKLVNTRE